MLILNKENSAARQPRKAGDDDVSTINAIKYEIIDGEVVKLTAGRCYATPVQDIAAESLCEILNAQIAHDGSWRVVWRNPDKQKWDSSSMIFRPCVPTLLQCQYLDKDGDVWCCVNIEDDVADIIEAGISTWVEQCENAYLFVHNLRYGVMDLRDGKDTKAVAKGEALTPTEYVPPATA